MTRQVHRQHSSCPSSFLSIYKMCFSCLRTFFHISTTLIHPSQVCVSSGQKQGLEVTTEQRRISCLSPGINPIKLLALAMSQSYILSTRTRNPACTTSGTTGQHADTHSSISVNLFFLFSVIVKKHSHKIYHQSANSAILQFCGLLHTHSVVGLHSLFLTDDTEGNMHCSKYPFVDCHSLANEIKIINAIIKTPVSFLLWALCLVSGQYEIIQRFLMWV